MPSQNSKNKGAMFRKIKDKIWKTLRKGNLFSVRGKEVLIKAIAQVIPTYTMSCFKISISICKDINSICANFWWGATKGKK